MPNSIDSEFRKRCAGNAALGLLLAQWEYDECLLERALGTIGHLFPHYSRHDASHSRTILERIAALLGEDKVASLGATDLWLLLEAAYFHDAGMVASHARKSEDVASEEFSLYLDRCAVGDEPELAQAARRLRAKVPRTTPSEILEGNFDLLLLYAEFVRRAHPKRAAEFAKDPLKHLSIPSPRTPLLPERFWHLVGQISRAHGEGCEFALTLPHEESGVGGELCHPRFVACMLRLGDLLDLDSGRFCGVLNSMIPRLPEISQAHRLKHEGVRHLVVSPRRIAVAATYTDINAYLQAEQWFSWLRDELQFQLLNWDQIAPTPDFGSLPSLGEVQARLEGQVILDHDSRPRFGVDREKMLELVRGANFYKGPHDTVREIVQNAIDATLIRFAFDRRCAELGPPKTLNQLRDELRRLPIGVSIHKASTSPSDPKMIRWVVKVRDQGIGLRERDLEFLLRLGSSSRNHDRRDLAAWLPEWARPSGTFGIGFHSLFEYCRTVVMRTRHPTDLAGFEITFETTEDGGQPLVMVKRWAPSAYPPPPGTSIEAEFDFPAVPSTVNSGNGEGEVERVLSEYDFVNDADLPYHPANMRDAVVDLGRLSLCTISLDGRALGAGAEQQEAVFDPNAGIEVRLLGASTKNARVDTLFRGAEVENSLLWPLLLLECNLHSGDARDLLELSRNKLKRKGNAVAKQKIEQALQICLPKWIGDLRAIDGNSELLPELSLYAELFGHKELTLGEWRALSIACEPVPLTLGALADAPTLDLHLAGLNAHSEGRPLQQDSSLGQLTLTNATHNNLPLMWFRRFLITRFPRRTFLGRSEIADSVRYRFEKGTAGEDVTDDGLRLELLRLRRRSTVGCRGALLCPQRFEGLSIPEGKIGWWNSTDEYMTRQMPSPFIVTKDAVTIPRPETFVRWLAKMRGESEERVASLTIEFLAHADEIMGEAWGVAKEYDLGAASAGLRGAFRVP